MTWGWVGDTSLIFILVCIKCLMCLTDRLVQYTLISLSFLLLLSLSLSFPQPTHEALFVIFLIQHSTSELIFFTKMYLSKSPSLSHFSSKRQKTTLYWPFSRQNYFQKMLLPHLHTISVDKTRSARAIWCFWRIRFSMLSPSRFFVLITAAP